MPGSNGLLHQYLQFAQPWLERYGPAALFVIVFVESFGIPAPGQTVLIAAALLAGQHHLSFQMVIAVAWVAAVFGDNLGYAIGYFGGRQLVHRFGSYVGLRDRHLDRIERFVDRFGGAVVMFARFFDVFRQLNGIVAGTSNMRWWEFALFNALGATLWVGVWGGGAYYLGNRLENLVDVFENAEPFVIGTGVLAASIALFWLVRRAHRGNGG